MKIIEPIDDRRKEEHRILNKYPKIFRQKDLSIQETCMCWGLDIGRGWMPLIDKLCERIQSYTDGNKHLKIKQVEATQVKQKFGGLRFYFTGGDDIVNGMVWFAEYLSEYICEECGSTKDVSQTKGCIVTLCKNCMGKSKEKKVVER